MLDPAQQATTKDQGGAVRTARRASKSRLARRQVTAECNQADDASSVEPRVPFREPDRRRFWFLTLGMLSLLTAPTLRFKPIRLGPTASISEPFDRNV